MSAYLLTFGPTVIYGNGHSHFFCKSLLQGSLTSISSRKLFINKQQKEEKENKKLPWIFCAKPSAYTICALMENLRSSLMCMNYFFTLNTQLRYRMSWSRIFSSIQPKYPYHFCEETNNLSTKLCIMRIWWMKEEHESKPFYLFGEIFRSNRPK